jgi:hypothetical protein
VTLLVGWAKRNWLGEIQKAWEKRGWGTVPPTANEMKSSEDKRGLFLELGRNGRAGCPLEYVSFGEISERGVFDRIPYVLVHRVKFYRGDIKAGLNFLQESKA